MVVQRCPSCGAKYDVSIYTSGRRVACSRCGYKFEVVRNDTPAAGPEKPQAAPPRTASGAQAPAAGPRSGGAPPLDPAIARGVQPAAPAAGQPAAAWGAIAPPAVKPPAPKQRLATSDLQRGDRLDNFELGEVLGRGAMGTVYRARQLTLDRPVAVKVMSSDLASQPEFILRFKREVAALTQVSHPNVVFVIEQGQVGDHWYFAMEYVDGPTLRKMLSPPRTVTMRQLLDLALQVGQGLDFAHAKGVVHRDLKPENVLVANANPDAKLPSYVPKICDFGLADILYSDASYVNLTGSRISMGTANYMAPEQRQDAGRVDHRADIYSFAVMLYEMLTGELPQGRVIEPSRRNPRVDRRLDGPVMRALEVDPTRRLGRVRELLEALELVRRDA